MYKNRGRIPEQPTKHATQNVTLLTETVGLYKNMFHNLFSNKKNCYNISFQFLKQNKKNNSVLFKPFEYFTFSKYTNLWLSDCDTRKSAIDRHNDFPEYFF